MSEPQLPRLQLTRAHKAELQAVAKMAGLDETPLQITVTVKGMERDKSGEGYCTIIYVID